MQSLRPHPRPTEAGSVFSQDTQGIQVHVIVWVCGHRNQLVIRGGCLLNAKVPRPSMRAAVLVVLGGGGGGAEGENRCFPEPLGDRAINSANSLELLPLILVHMLARWKSSLQPPALQVGDGPEKPQVCDFPRRKLLGTLEGTPCTPLGLNLGGCILRGSSAGRREAEGGLG